MYRQGDILLIPTGEKLPVDAEPAPDGVVAEGEATGHAHRLDQGAKRFVRSNGTQFVEVAGTRALLTHEEHGTIELPGPAVYVVQRQREYVPPAPKQRRPATRIVSD